MNNKMKLAGLILGAALTASTAYAASGSCGAGKCGGDIKKEVTEKAAGSCGAGKCGGDMKKEVKEKAAGSCGAGKCGSK